VGTVYIVWAAKSMDEVKERLAILAKNKIFLEEYIKSDACPCWRLKGLYVSIYLSPRWYDEKEEGATCKLVQVGTKPSEPIPIFKLVCDKEEIKGE